MPSATSMAHAHPAAASGMCGSPPVAYLPASAPVCVLGPPLTAVSAPHSLQKVPGGQKVGCLARWEQQAWGVRSGRLVTKQRLSLVARAGKAVNEAKKH